MLIGFDGSRAFVGGRTGTENYSYQLLKNIALVDQKNDYLIYLRPGQHPDRSWPVNFRFKTLDYSRLWTQIGLSVATFTDGMDVLFVPSHTLPLIRRPGLRTVITVHDLGAEYLPFTHQLKQILYLKLMTHYQLKTATKIIAVSEATKKDLVKKAGLESEKISVVYEGVDKKVFRKLPKDILRDVMNKFGLEPGKYFLFVGTIQPRKNIERLIVAFSKFLSQLHLANGQVLSSKYQVSREKPSAKLASLNTNPLILIPKFKLILVGQKGWKSDQIYNLPKELGIEGQVKFLGRISDTELVALYNGATALTYPSLFEGFGLPILEASACGCPVITSNTSSMPEVAGRAGILVDPLNTEEITEAMLKLHTNDIFRNNLINKGYINLKRFDWEKTAWETVKILIEAVKG